MGIKTPILRSLAKCHYKTIDDSTLLGLLRDKIHEYRALALMILVNKSEKADLNELMRIVDIYLENIDYVNNWDLVDLSAVVVGRYAYWHNQKEVIYKLSKSKNLWYKRIAIVSTWIFIKNKEFDITFDIVDYLIDDTHHLIHKACGWMLREIGKRDVDVLTNYLQRNYQKLSRTTLRYAIEKYPEEIRKKILKGEFVWK